jgi:hypothetical protein
MMSEQTFELKQEHLLLLRELEWMPGDYGTPETDQKRPYGSSGRYAIARDIGDILGWDFKDDYVPRASILFEELSTALKVILQNCVIKPGEYVKPHREAEWRPKL